MAANRDTAFREQQMLEIAKKAILDSGDFLSQDQTAQRLGLPPMSQDEWEAEGQVFSIQHAGSLLFPKYAFQGNAGHRPAPGLQAILDGLRAMKDGWGMVFWFASSNPFLGGRRPQQMLCSNAEKVLLAANEEILGITHR